MPQKKKYSNHRNLLFWIILGLLLSGGLIWAFWPRAQVVEIATVTRGPYEQVVVEEGRTRAKEIFKIPSPVEGNLKRVELHAGDMVRKGDFLAEVDWPKAWQITSPISGKILKILRESGGPIERGETIMEIADTSELEILSEILTEDAVQIKKGDPVRIHDWGGCSHLNGKVRVVEPAAFTKISALGIEEQRVNVIIDVNSAGDACGSLSDGFRVHNHIVIFQTEDALTIPTGALFRDGAEWSVFKISGGRVHQTHVEIARRNPQLAMIKSGLKEEDQVVVYPSDQIEEGTRVKPMDTRRGNSKN